jgi:hypothetical protein
MCRTYVTSPFQNRDTVKILEQYMSVNDPHLVCHAPYRTHFGGLACGTDRREDKRSKSAAHVTVFFLGFFSTAIPIITARLLRVVQERLTKKKETKRRYFCVVFALLKWVTDIGLRRMQTHHKLISKVGLDK